MASLTDLFEAYLDNVRTMERDIKDALAINRDDVMQDMQHHAEAVFHWGRLAAIAEARYEQAKKIRDEQVWNSIKNTIRIEADRLGKKVTDKQLDELCYQHARWATSGEDLNRMYEMFLTLQKAEKAMWARTTMIQSYNSRQRAEMQSYPSD